MQHCTDGFAGSKRIHDCTITSTALLPWDSVLILLKPIVRPALCSAADCLYVNHKDSVIFGSSCTFAHTLRLPLYKASNAALQRIV